MEANEPKEEACSLEVAESPPSKDLKGSSSSLSQNGSWLVGDIVWSKIPGHPWWPSMVSYEPINAVYFRVRGRAKYYHVQFFGQEPVRGWVAEKAIVRFEGREHFESTVHGKHLKVGVRRLQPWENAIKFAEKALPMNRHQRLLCFTFKYYDKRGAKKEVSPKVGKHMNGLSKGGLEPTDIRPDSSALSQRLENDLVCIDQNNDQASRTSHDQHPKRVRKRNRGAALSPTQSETPELDKDLKTEPVPKRRKQKSSPVVPSADAAPENNLVMPIIKEIAKDLNDQSPNAVNGIVTPPRLNGDYQMFPVNGELSPNSALKLKIRKVRQGESPGKGKRGRPQKVRETFVIVNPPEEEKEQELHSTPVVENEPASLEKEETSVNVACPNSSSTHPQVVQPVKKKRGRPKKIAVVPAKVKKPESKTAKSEEAVKVSESVPNGLVVAKVASLDKEGSIASSNDDETASSKTAPRRDKDTVCVVCEQLDNLIFCDGICGSAYHADCIGLSSLHKEKFICDECTSGNHSCFSCKQTGNVQQCSQPNCTKFYHESCLKPLKTARFDGERFFCPLHSCTTCAMKNKTVAKGKLTRCVRCPTAYHMSGCLVAGCIPISPQLMTCAKHFMPEKSKAHHSHVNVNWCFVCSIGGTLICCESCPAAFHPECISYEGIPEGHFFCKDCIEGKQQLYGDIVWVKLGMYRWWPAQICNPREVPTNIQNMRHQPGEFPVMFLGSHDYYWIHKGRVFSYQEGDKGSSDSGTKVLAKLFRAALLEAKEKYAEWKKDQENREEQDMQKMFKKPAAYKHLKVNKHTTAQRYCIIPSEWPVCECSPLSEGPCGPDSNCLNRMLQFECNPNRCPAKEKCQNQRFQKRQYADCEAFRALHRGWGLRTKKALKKGDFAIEYVGELIDEASCRERIRKGDDNTNYYMLTIDKDYIIDAGPMGNLARFMNHCCDPNCETQKWNVNGDIKVGLFASRNIKEGEELTFDYQLDCLGNEKKKCYCGAKNCSGFLGVRPKTQSAMRSEDLAKKAAEKKKKKRRRPKKIVVKEVHEDECFLCGDGGELIMCDKSGCAKCYHVNCLKLEDRPRGKWICPWHFCDNCGKRAVVLCADCPNSFCKKDSDGQITCVGDNIYICNDHILTRNKNPSKTADTSEEKPDFVEQCQEQEQVTSTIEAEL